MNRTSWTPTRFERSMAIEGVMVHMRVSYSSSKLDWHGDAFIAWKPERTTQRWKATARGSTPEKCADSLMLRATKTIREDSGK